MIDPLARLFHIAQVHDTGTSTVLDGGDQLIPGVRLDPAAFAGTRVVVLDSLARRHETTCVRFAVSPSDMGQRLVIEVAPRVASDALVGGTVMVEPRLVPPPSAPRSTVIAIEASAAAGRGLPPIGIRLDTAGAAMGVSVFPDARRYLGASGPPGAPLSFHVLATQATAFDAAAVERELRAALAADGPVEVTEHATVMFAGAARPAVVAVTRKWQEVTWLGAFVPARAGAVFVLACATYGPGRRATAADLMAASDLAPLFRSLVIEGAQTASAPITASTRMAFESGRPAPPDPRPQPPRQVKIDGWEQALIQRASLRRALGALLGLAVGDALGTTNEFKALEAPPFPELATGPLDDIVGGGPFKLKPGEVTDDTQMAAVLAEVFWKSSQLSNGVLSVRYVAWQKVAFDVGVQIGQALDLVARGTYPERAGRQAWEDRNRFPAGNGSLMRTAVIGTLLAAMPPDVRRAAAFLDSAITHFDPRCQLACAAFNAAIAHALTDRPSPASMIRAAADELKAAAEALRAHHVDLRAEIDAAEAGLASDLVAAREDDPDLYGDELHLHKSAGYVRVAFRLAFWELMHAPDFRAAVIDVANRGGDADTNAAITGALLGAFHGVDAIPFAWIDKVLTAPALVAEERELHPRTFLHALARGFDPALDARSVLQLAPFVGLAFPQLPGERGPSAAAPAELAGMRVQAWLRGSTDFGQARVLDPHGRAFIATVGPPSPVIEAEPPGLPLSIPMLPLRSRHAVPLLVQLLQAVRAAADVGRPIVHLSPELVYIANESGPLRITGILSQGDVAALATDRARRLAWIPQAMSCAAPEIIAGAQPTMMSGIYSACALYLFLCNRNDSRNVPALLDKAVADVVRAGLQPDPMMRPPARVMIEIIAAARG